MSQNFRQIFLYFALTIAGFLQAEPLQTNFTKLELISEQTAIVPGESFHLALRYELQPHWHIYWENPGASGAPPMLTWELPEGIEASEMEWPAPKRIESGGLVSYGYEGEPIFIIPMRASESLEPGTTLSIKLSAFWLICDENGCYPDFGDMELSLPVAEKSELSQASSYFEQARASQPLDSSPWKLSAAMLDEGLRIRIEGAEIPAELYFFSDSEELVDPNAPQILSAAGAGMAELDLVLNSSFSGELPTEITGLLQTEDQTWRVQIEPGSLSPMALPLPDTSAEPVGFEQNILSLGLPGFILLAFLGGLILNIMPCVLPVLSLKVFSLLNHVGQSKRQALIHGLAYTAGVVLSFLLLAGLLFALRAAGEQIGWGFQLQSPGFVVFLTVIFFLFGLNLMGVFEIGSSLVGADSKVSKRKDAWGSFGMGVLAAVVGAPCMGPLLAGVSGVAVQVNLASGLLIFAMMGFGLASPFLLLSFFPKLVAFLPKPGAWMESFKQAMGFMLMAAVVFLVYVAGNQGGTAAILALQVVILLTAIGGWVYGRWAAPVRSARSKWIARLLALALIGGGLNYGIQASRAAYEDNSGAVTKADASGQWEAWSEERVQSELTEGNSVFVDFTATWCLICQVNKKVALRTEATEALFKKKGIVALSADWTRYDPAITNALESFNRSGVPLYLLYTPDGKVVTLPQSLTNGIVREAVEKALGD